MASSQMPKPPELRARQREHDAKRGTARQRGYDARWDKARKSYLLSNPHCVMCKREGHITCATVVDHIIAHKGDMALFWDKTNWQSLCAPHHNGAKRSEEMGRKRQAVDADGWPL